MTTYVPARLTHGTKIFTRLSKTREDYEREGFGSSVAGIRIPKKFAIYSYESEPLSMVVLVNTEWAKVTTEGADFNLKSKGKQDKNNLCFIRLWLNNAQETSVGSMDDFIECWKSNLKAMEKFTW